MAFAEDKARFREAVAKRRLEPVPPGFLDGADHEAVARAAVDGNPDLMARARDRQDFFPLIRAAEQAAGKGNVSTFLLASLIGQMVRGERRPAGPAAPSRSAGGPRRRRTASGIRSSSAGHTGACDRWL